MGVARSWMWASRKFHNEDCTIYQENMKQEKDSLMFPYENNS